MVLSTQEVVIHPLGTSQAFHFYALHGSCSMNTSPPFFFATPLKKFNLEGGGGGVVFWVLHYQPPRFVFAMDLFICVQLFFFKN